MNMKELSIEEKVKRYDEAIEKAKGVIEQNPLMEYLKKGIEYIFPELKESEDEMMRNAAINACKYMVDNFENSTKQYEDAIAWLEKQGEHNNWKPSKEEMDVLYGLAYITNQYDEHKEEVITHLYQDLKREFFNGLSYENMFPNTEDGVRRRSTIQILEYARSLDTYNQYGKADIDKNIAWLERQGEQKFVEYTLEQAANIFLDALSNTPYNNKPITDAQVITKELLKFLSDTSSYNPNALNEQKPNPCDGCINRKGCINCENGELRETEQKPTDKVEQKFHEGDWITDDTSIFQIMRVKNEWYYADDGDKICFDVAHQYYHLWTIADAKDGDILFQDLIGGKTFIYNGVNPEMVILYSFIISNDGENVLPYHIGKPNTGIGNIEENKNIIHPATKEQRDLLFQKMKEAGYEWDAEKKELKKIEQKPAEEIVDEINRKAFPNHYGGQKPADKVETYKDKLLELFQKFRWKGTPTNGDIIEYVDAHIQELINTIQKPVWSEEDELSCFESALFTAFSYAWQSYLLGEEVNVKQWAKEQSKELLEAAKEELKVNNTAWSEEDEKIYQSIMDDTVQENQLNDKQTNWLRGIKYRYFTQPKQEWSEEDEKNFKKAIKVLKVTNFHHTADMLQEMKYKLIPREETNNWKPSNEQMQHLSEVVHKAKYKNDISVGGYSAYMPLASLYLDLKKLKGE